jgi:excisionase family DNA binding protein
MSKGQIETPPAARPERRAAPEYESKQELAARLGVSTRTIDNLMTRGLPYLALTGKLRRFPRVSVDAWLQRQEVRRK